MRSIILLLIGCTTLGGGQVAAQTPAEVIAEIRVHGNHTTNDDEILRFAQVKPGDVLGADTVQSVEARLRQTGRFKNVEVRKRYRMIEPGAAVVLVLIVEERVAGGGGPFQHLMFGSMLLPILGYQDGYGFTYGVRASFIDSVGDRSRISIPLTWGGTKQAALEVEKYLTSGPVTRVSGRAAIAQRRNPHFRIDDERREVGARAERAFSRFVRAGGRVGWTDISFGAVDDRFVSWGADLTFDTRHDPDLPRNAGFVELSWETLRVNPEPVHRSRIDGRGFLGLIGQSVFAVRAVREIANRPLPSYERWLLGGAASLRGYRAGAFSGDNLLAASAELRIPLNSPLDFGKLGVSIFVDTGTAYDHGVSLGDARFRTGVGAGVFLKAAVFRLNLDVASDLKGGMRTHVSSGFQF